MYEITCVMCDTVFTHQQPNILTCSNDCRKKRYLEITGRQAYQTELPTGTVGAIAEMEVAVDMMKSGYSVFRALSPSCRTDLIAVKGRTLLSVEVRTGYVGSSGKVFYPSRKNDDADIYAAYVSRLNKVFYFMSDKVTPYEI